MDSPLLLWFISRKGVRNRATRHMWSQAALSGVQLLDSLSSCGRSRRSNQWMERTAPLIEMGSAVKNEHRCCFDADGILAVSIKRRSRGHGCSFRKILSDESVSPVLPAVMRGGEIELDRTERFHLPIPMELGP